jgi:hypothetical protein
MHQHDQELILALAEDSLGPEAARAARETIASCQQCTQDLELQQFARDALGSLPEAQLTEMESARLRRDLRTELGLTKQTVMEPSRRRRRMPLAALGTAAAVLLAVVVAGPGLNLIGSSGSDTDDTSIVADAPLREETTAASTTSAPAALESVPNAAGGQEDTALTTLAPDQTLAAVSTTEALQDKLYGYFSDVPDLPALRDEAAATGFDPEAVRSQALRDADESVFDETQDQSLACINVTLTIDSNLIDGFQIARGEVEGRDVLYVIYLAEDLEESLLLVQAADNCEELGRVGP